jgi:hypothetical protein
VSVWIDGNEPDQQRAAIQLEDAANLIRSAGWLIERLDRRGWRTCRMAR